MLRTLALLFLFFAVLQAASVNYIMAFKKPVSDDLYKTAREEVEAAGGKVLYEYKSALKGILVQLPSQEFNTFSSKPYVDFFEKDSSVHI